MAQPTDTATHPAAARTLARRGLRVMARELPLKLLFAVDLAARADQRLLRYRNRAEPLGDLLVVEALGHPRVLAPCGRRHGVGHRLALGIHRLGGGATGARRLDNRNQEQGPARPHPDRRETAPTCQCLPVRWMWMTSGGGASPISSLPTFTSLEAR